MKKLFFLSVVVVLVGAIIFGGCAAPAPAPSPAPAPAPAPSPAPKPAPAPTPTPAPAPAPAPAPKPAPAPAPAPAGKVYELSLNLPIPPIHTRVKTAVEPWCNEVMKRTNGRVKIIPYYAEALSTMPENYDSVAGNIADMGECAIGFKAGRFPYWENIFNFTTPNIAIGGQSFMAKELLDTFPVLRDEFKETKLLFVHSSTAEVMGTSKKPIKTLADFKGVKANILGAGVVVDKWRAIGISPATILMSDVYMAVDRGVLDGTAAAFELMVARKWGDVIKHMTPVVMSTRAFYMVMNKNTWNKLPPDIQKVFEELSGDYAMKMFDDYWWKTDAANKEIWEKQMGGQTHNLSEADMAEIVKLTRPVMDKYVDSLEAKGIKMKPIYVKFQELEKKYAMTWPWKE